MHDSPKNSIGDGLWHWVTTLQLSQQSGQQWFFDVLEPCCAKNDTLLDEKEMSTAKQQTSRDPQAVSTCPTMMDIVSANKL